MGVILHVGGGEIEKVQTSEEGRKVEVGKRADRGEERVKMEEVATMQGCSLSLYPLLPTLSPPASVAFFCVLLNFLYSTLD